MSKQKKSRKPRSKKSRTKRKNNIIKKMSRRKSTEKIRIKSRRKSRRKSTEKIRRKSRRKSLRMSRRNMYDMYDKYNKYDKYDKYDKGFFTNLEKFYRRKIYSNLPNFSNPFQKRQDKKDITEQIEKMFNEIEKGKKGQSTSNANEYKLRELIRKLPYIDQKKYLEKFISLNRRIKKNTDDAKTKGAIERAEEVRRAAADMEKAEEVRRAEEDRRAAAEKKSYQDEYTNIMFDYMMQEKHIDIDPLLNQINDNISKIKNMNRKDYTDIVNLYETFKNTIKEAEAEAKDEAKAKAKDEAKAKAKAKDEDEDEDEDHIF
jgi:hypothetical protein